MRWLGKKWDDVYKELLQNDIDFSYKVTFPAGKVTAAGDLRVARVNFADGRLLFVLIHDKFIK